jgi:hypothetical protein
MAHLEAASREAQRRAAGLEAEAAELRGAREAAERALREGAFCFLSRLLAAGNEPACHHSAPSRACMQTITPPTYPPTPKPPPPPVESDLAALQPQTESSARQASELEEAASHARSRLPSAQVRYLHACMHASMFACMLA